MTKSSLFIYLLIHFLVTDFVVAAVAILFIVNDPFAVRLRTARTPEESLFRSYFLVATRGIKITLAHMYSNQHNTPKYNAMD